MELHSPGSIFLQLGPLTIRWYGVMIALGFICASIAVSVRARQWGIDGEKVINCALITFMSGIVGARLYFVALSWDYFTKHLAEIFATWNGGLSIHGGIMFGTIAGFMYGRRVRLPLLKTADLFGAVTPLAQAIGRWGNFFNSELYGSPVSSDFPIRLFIPAESRLSGYQEVSYFQPAFLYESLWNLALFLLLYFALLDRLRKYPGLTFSLYILGYSLGRALIEPMRLDSIRMGGVQVAYIVSLVLLILSIVACLYFIVRARSIQAR